MKQKVLIIEDSITVQLLLKRCLANEPVDLHTAFDGETGLSLAAQVQPDLILLDVEMPHPDGFEVCRRLKADPLTVTIPVIFVTGATSTAQKVAGLELGAVDYIAKPFDPAEAWARVRASLRTKYLLDLLAKRAQIDGLTGIWNRAYLDQRIIAEVSEARRYGRPLSLIMMDIDHFKAINDRFGHPCGDDALREVGQLLRQECRVEDVVCRYGGEEFAILTPGIDEAGALCLAERLRQRIMTHPITRGSIAIELTSSFGVAEMVDHAVGATIHAADQALYQAKRAGRNCCFAARSGRAVIEHAVIKQNTIEPAQRNGRDGLPDRRASAA